MKYLGHRLVWWQLRSSLSRRAPNILRLSKTRGVYNALFICRSEFWIDFPAPHLAVLQSTRNFKATDPRDKVFAMLTQPLNMQQRDYKTFQRMQWGLFTHQYISLRFLQLLVTLPFWFLLKRAIPGGWTPWRIFSQVALAFCLLDISRLVLNLLPSLWSRASTKAPTRVSLPDVRWVTTTMSELLHIRADYTMPIVDEVNKLVALKTITNFQRFDFLSFVHHEDPVLLDETKPSWVPRWELHTGSKEILASFGSDPYNADVRETLKEVIFSKAPVIEDFLAVEGLQIGNVSSVSGIMYASDFKLDKPQIVRDIILEHGKSVDTYAPTGTDARKACIRTLTASQGLRGLRINEKDHEAIIRKGMRLFSGQTQSLYASMTTRVDPRYVLESKRNHEAARRVCHLRRHFVTVSGYQGIGPAQMAPDDVVFVIIGCRCPLVLRKIESYLYMYRLVGECYVHGIMDGEAIAEWKAGRLSWDAILLC